MITSIPSGDLDPVEAALIDAIIEDPESPGPYQVYGDWLEAHEKLRGQLIVLSCATEDRPGDHRISDAALDHIQAHVEYYLGRAAVVLRDQGWHDLLEVQWRYGFLSSIEVNVWNEHDLRGVGRQHPQ